MKNRPLLTMTLLSSSLVAGCAWLPWHSETTTSSSREAHGRIVPHARIQDGADSAAAFHALGRHLQREGRLEDAERAYMRALDFDPAYAEARNALAVLAARRGDLSLAVDMLSSLVASHPEQPHLLTNLGYAHYLKGEYVLARERLMQALRIAPDNESARQKLARVREKLGEPDDPPDAVPMAIEPAHSPKAAADHKDANSIVKLTDGVYELIRPLSHEAASPYAARCEFPDAAQAQSAQMAAAPPLPPPAANESKERLRLELLNGNGINRLARSVRDLISGPQWQVVRVLNHDDFSVPVTRIEYAKHRYGDARELAGALGVAAQLRPNYQQGDTQLRVVLGKDFRTTEGLRERVASTLPLLADSQ